MLTRHNGPVLNIQTKQNPAGGIKTVEHCGDTGCLYNIKEEPEERVNLASKMPNVLKQMQSKLAKYQAA